jgi:biopolymer transport protein TolR
MAGGAQQDDEEITGINVTPLVDIVLVLLIIFMVTANFIVRETVEVDVPTASKKTVTETPEGPAMVTVDKDGKLYFDGAETTEEELRSKLAAVVKKNKDTIAVITADQALNYGRVMRVIDIVKTEGVAKFALNIKTEVTPAPTP